MSCRISTFVLCLVTSLISCISIAADDGVPQGFPPLQAIRTLKRPNIRVELDLDPDQVESLIALEVDRQTLDRGPLNRGDEATLEERRRSFEEFLRQWRLLEEKALAVLRPTQRVRLEQIVLQEKIRADSPRGGVTHPEMVKRLGLVEPQLEAVRQKIIEAERTYKERLEELLAEIDKAKRTARQQVLGELTPEQRKQYEELIGEAFDSQPLGDDLIVIQR